MDEITIDGYLSQNLIKVLTEICIQLQKQFDISPCLVNTFINREEFINSANEINKKFYEHIKNSFLDIHNKYTPEDFMNRVGVSPMGSVIESSCTDWGEENCGFQLKKHPNGYIEYCNKHKYLHSDESHEFTRKTHKQIIDERQLNDKIKLYQNYLDKLLELLYNKMLSYINENYKTIRFNVDEIHMGVLDSFDKDECFKTRIVESKVDTNFVFNSFVDIYIPNDKFDFYNESLNNADQSIPLEGED
jgi:hypothetical protein